MGHGMYVKASNGTLLANTEYPTYVLHEVLSPVSSEGKVYTYFTTSPSEPLVFINIVAGASAGVLNIEAALGGYTIRIIASTGLTIYVFRVIRPSDGATGYGANFYNSAGNLTYSTAAKVLLGESIAPVSVGSVFGHGGNTLASHIAANTYATSTTNTSWVYTGEVIPSITLEPVLTYVCRQDQSYQCSYDPVSGMVNCFFVPITVCGYETVLTLVTHYTYLFAKVRRTDWEVYRGCLKNSGTQFEHDWVLHRSGYYNEVLEFAGATTSTAFDGSALPAGYQPPAYLLALPQFYGSAGEFTYNNTFPYTTGVSNNLSATAVLTRTTNYV